MSHAGYQLAECPPSFRYAQAWLEATMPLRSRPSITTTTLLAPSRSLAHRAEMDDESRHAPNFFAKKEAPAWRTAPVSRTVRRGL